MLVLAMREAVRLLSRLGTAALIREWPKGPGPFVISGIITSRLDFEGPAATKTVEASNPDFDPGFFVEKR